MVRRIALLLLLLLSSFAWPVYVHAQGGDGEASTTRHRLTELIGDITGTLEEYRQIVTLDFSSVAEQYLGPQWLSTQKTGYAYDFQNAPANYYPDAPEQVRDWGYTLESLKDVSTNEMTPLDFASWLGGLVALPFAFVRGLWALGDIFGPLGLFIRWLMLAASWVLFIYTIEYIAKFVRSVYEIGMALTRFIVSLKP